MVTAIEVFEHLVNPAAELDQMLRLSDTILFTTELQPKNIDNLSDWHYFAPETGQHISLYHRESLAALATTFGETIARLQEDIYAAVGHEFNLGSPKQLEQVLFYELDLPKGKRTKTGYSTDASVLEDLRPAHPMIDKLLEWRIYTKLRSTYVEALPTLIADDGRLHTTFHQAVAATGRLSSSDPNLQNIPIRTELGRRPRPRPAGRRLLADRAAHPGPRVR